MKAPPMGVFCHLETLDLSHNWLKAVPLSLLSISSVGLFLFLPSASLVRSPSLISLRFVD